MGCDGYYPFLPPASPRQHNLTALRPLQRGSLNAWVCHVSEGSLIRVISLWLPICMLSLLASFTVRPHRSDSHRRYFRECLLLGVLLGLALLLTSAFYRTRPTLHLTMEAGPLLLPQTGLDELEHFPDRSATYSWTNGRGRVVLANPGGVRRIDLTLASGPGGPRTLQISDDMEKLSFLVQPSVRTYRMVLPPVPTERATVALDSPTMLAGSRKVGVLVSAIGLRGDGHVPSQLLVALALMTVGGYALLRRFGWSIAGA